MMLPSAYLTLSAGEWGAGGWEGRPVHAAMHIHTHTHTCAHCKAAAQERNFILKTS